MAQDEAEVLQGPAPDDGEDMSSPHWLVRHPFLTSIAIGFASALVIGLLMPAHITGAPADLTVAVASNGETAPAVETKVPDATPRTTTATSTPTTTAAPVHDATATKPLGNAPTAAVTIVAEAAIVVADTGLNRKVAEEIDKDMPRDATLAVSVYATDPAGTASAFKASGRDVWLQAATQSTKGGIDPGPLAVSGSLSTKDNTGLFQRQVTMAGSGNVIGIFIPEDADITGADPDMWRDLATNLIGENLMILDATPAKVATSLYMQKQESKISAYLKTDVMISGDMGPAALQKALADAVPIILREQQAVVVMNKPTVMAVQMLADWIKALPAKGIRLVPATKFTGLKG